MYLFLGLLYLKFIFLPVDDDGGNLLVHEDQYKGQEGGDDGGHGSPPGVLVTDGADKPAAVLVSRGL